MGAMKPIVKPVSARIWSFSGICVLCAQLLFLPAVVKLAIFAFACETSQITVHVIANHDPHFYSLLSWCPAAPNEVDYFREKNPYLFIVDQMAPM